ncbi:MAG: ectonucleotide pyrophosphatase/phosphodiesterase [Melioribacteraceae bacterium]|nr:alkaline phosphatase family protein [Melioribacteraceae bacterium]MDD3557402.1 ectonucleotide pyrophosphatase/phosphodiesterase [Melioribacteraceae bacterium]
MKKILSAIILFALLVLSLNAQQPYVILVSFDGFRWDYTERGLTPNLDKIKNDGVAALSLQPSYPSKTFPNHYSIITGMYPENHGIIANDFYNVLCGLRYKVGDTISVRNSDWYNGEAFWETAERNGIKCASYFWPGSEVNNKLRRPSYFKYYEHNTPRRQRIDEVINWLELPYSERPKFITLYFHDTDDVGHEFGPNSTEIDECIMRMDSLAEYLFSRINELSFADSINVIFVSDHGMTGINSKKIINIDEILSDISFTLEGDKTFAFIKTDPGNINTVYEILKNNENKYRVYLKRDMPEYLHFSNNPNIPEIIMIADLGWSILDSDQLQRFESYGGKGNHGYDNTETDMHGIFIANGPAFKSGFRTGTISNIDIYPMLCEIFKIEPNKSIDGNLVNIEHILK